MASTFCRCSTNLSEMYVRKIKPSTRCLYSAASIWARGLSALAQSTALTSLAGASFFALGRRPGAGAAKLASGAWWRRPLNALARAMDPPLPLPFLTGRNASALSLICPYSPSLI